MSLALQHAYDDNGLMFAASYWLGRIMLGTTNPRPLRHGRGTPFNPFVVSMVATGPLLVVGGLLDSEARLVVWTVAALLDLATPTLFRSRMREMHFDASHLTERFGLFVLIALGESVIAVGTSTDVEHLGVAEIAAVAAAFVLSCGLWWVYFHFAADAVRHAIATAQVQLDRWPCGDPLRAGVRNGTAQRRPLRYRSQRTARVRRGDCGVGRHATTRWRIPLSTWAGTEPACCTAPRQFISRRSASITRLVLSYGHLCFIDTAPASVDKKVERIGDRLCSLSHRSSGCPATDPSGQRGQMTRPRSRGGSMTTTAFCARCQADGIPCVQRDQHYSQERRRGHGGEQGGGGKQHEHYGSGGEPGDGDQPEHRPSGGCESTTASAGAPHGRGNLIKGCRRAR